MKPGEAVMLLRNYDDRGLVLGAIGIVGKFPRTENGELHVAFQYPVGTWRWGWIYERDLQAVPFPCSSDVGLCGCARCVGGASGGDDGQG